MRLPLRQSWRLRGIERELVRSAPHLGAMLAIFARLTAGEAVTGREQLSPPGNWVGLVLVMLADAMTCLLAAMCRHLRQAARLPSRARRLVRTVRAPLYLSAAEDAARRRNDYPRAAVRPGLAPPHAPAGDRVSDALGGKTGKHRGEPGIGSAELAVDLRWRPQFARREAHDLPPGVLPGDITLFTSAAVINRCSAKTS